MTRKTTEEGVTTYDYSSRGELLSVSLPDGTLITYDHDPLGRRVVKWIDGAIVEKYLWQGVNMKLLAVYDGADNLVRRFMYADGRMPASMTIARTTYYLAYDQVGSLRAVVESAGVVVKRIDYDTFGNIVSDSNPVLDVPFGFSGGLHDRRTGLVRFGARDYDPKAGRWIAKDPIDFGGRQSNLYQYVSGDPVGLIDPLGLFDFGLGGTFGPITYKWDTSRPLDTQIEILTDLEIGGGFTFIFDNPIPDSDSPAFPFDVNVGVNRWFSVSTNNQKMKLNIGWSIGITPVDISFPVCP